MYIVYNIIIIIYTGKSKIETYLANSIFISGIVYMHEYMNYEYSMLVTKLIFICRNGMIYVHCLF